MVSSDWIMCMDKRPIDRSDEDLHIIYARMKDLHTFEKFHPMLLQQLCYYGYYEDLEKGVTLFRQGDIGCNWYAVLSGTLDVKVSQSGDAKNSIVLCKFGTGAAFGESVLNDTPRHATVVTSNYCELIRVEQKDFKMLWERNKRFMEAIINPNLGSHLDACTMNVSPENSSIQPVHPLKSALVKTDELPNPAAPITMTPSKQLARAGHVIRTILLTRAPHMIRDRKYHLRTYRRCMIATEMVDWLLQHGSFVHSRNQAIGMWQALLEEGVVMHVCHEHQFKDKYLFYRFFVDDQGIGSSPTNTDKKESEEELQETLAALAGIAPDAMLRMILRKLPHERSVEDLEIIYEELIHIKALSHLSTMVKRELASVLVFESHSKAGGVLFNQGDEGKSWYIILKGSVNVVIYGKGVVCTLHEGDDFGKLALVNDAPRAATIVLREDNCHFLRVDKEDFNRILRDVEANTVRLKEHGKDVLVLEKIPLNVQGLDGSIHTNYKYSVMAGTPDKMLEHLLETRIGKSSNLPGQSDTFLEDFLLTHVVFMPSNHLCPTLMAHYHAELSDQESEEPGDLALTNKKQVIQFVKEWCRTIGGAFWEDRTIMAFLEELHSAVLEDSKMFSRLRDEVAILDQVILKKPSHHDSYCHANRKRSPLHYRPQTNENIIRNEHSNDRRQPIKATDTNVFHTYSADHSSCTLKIPMDCSVEIIIAQTQDKLSLGNDLVLCEVKSSREKIVFKDNDLCVTTGLSVNGRLFVCPREHVENLIPLPDQSGPTIGTYSAFELMSSREIAFQMTMYDWELCNCVHEYELIYLVFGRYKFSKITANLDIFLKRFNEIQLWVVTEMCLLPNLSKRIQLLRKFIKIAAYCKEYQNLNAFFAIVMGLSNVAVSRLSLTWEKLPNKFKKMFSEFETLMDPSRNHRVYRLNVAKMQPPVIPFMPLLMKDMTFTHEGNKTHFDGLVNFEKMHMIAQTLRNIRTCRSKPLDVESTGNSKNSQEIKTYIRNFKVIDNQRALTALSHKLEPRRT